MWHFDFNAFIFWSPWKCYYHFLWYKIFSVELLNWTSLCVLACEVPMNIVGYTFIPIWILSNNFNFTYIKFTDFFFTYLRTLTSSLYRYLNSWLIFLFQHFINSTFFYIVFTCLFDRKLLENIMIYSNYILYRKCFKLKK